jgi:hypothetical protein
MADNLCPIGAASPLHLAAVWAWGGRSVDTAAVADPWEDEFDPSISARNALRWAHELGASTLGEAYDLLDQLEVSNDIPELLGQEDTVEDVRQEFELGLDLVGADAPLSGLL